jgi:Fic family protein
VDFRAHPLPPAFYRGPLFALAIVAAARLGELRDVGRTLPNSHLLIGSFRRREAVASSRIEGTITTLSDLFLFEAEAREPIGLRRHQG